MPDETNGTPAETTPADGPGKLGKRPARGDPRLLAFARFVQLDKVPATYDPWKKRAAFPARSFGNRTFGCCTKASEALHHLRFERVETRRNASITDDEVVDRYFAMTWRNYGGGADGSPPPPDWRIDGDMGAYELDALSEWRKPEFTFRDAAGHALTIDAYTAVNHRDVEEVKAAICLSGKFGMKLCLNLPAAWQRVNPPDPWDVPEGQPFTGEWEPGSWGGHSLYCDSYDKTGVRLIHSWYDQPEAVTQQLTWRGMASFADEAYWIVDSVDSWRKRTPQKLAENVDLAGIVKQVNKVSSYPLKK
jgi:hypothetical protein